MQEETCMMKIGMLTSGGDCQALNATMRGVVKGLANNVKDLEVYGFMNGYKGLIYSDYRMLSAKDFSGILTQGGTILGTSRQPFKLMRTQDANGLDNKKNKYKHQKKTNKTKKKQWSIPTTSSFWTALSFLAETEPRKQQTS